jgi:hypothetical protein
MHAHIVVGFDFSVSFDDKGIPRFDERAEGRGGEAPTNFDAASLPVWNFGRDEDGTPTITSPDGATIIVLYGLKLNTAEAVLFEAGVRSNEYRNLGGQCRQVNLSDGRSANTSLSEPGANAK